MSSFRVRETFFRPDRAFGREPSALPADIYNGLQLLLARDGGACVFLPVRSMQYQAVIDREEIVFVDANGGYAHQDGVGGRLIRIAWQPILESRGSLSEPVPYDIVYYFPGLKEVQWRLLGETRAALRQTLERQRGPGHAAIERRVISFRRRSQD
ncbi:MAG: hypothetical protein ACM3ST_13605 [Bdellovibrio bacteriovorus]